ncbi:methyl-accepting chemotaxis protein [Desulfovibrio mangrovi]|uniref:HAMP domain-containing methyl-accepting chemotaxis protein n=1 Tax=Desulfovibrio mangrovi TaxID=2976983 RepID=UPI0022458F3B|nr:methyl-accepting chemotaxis protein [Desulfovibrio mangrovi]UZP66338.1 methyl-accepting chemotaxis protein [Desulfovibrio mangrovi]
MLDNMKLSVKLYSGFLVVLALLTILGGTGFFAIDSASDGFSSYREMARDTNLAGRIQANMLTVRMAVKDFIITGSEDSAKVFDERFNGVRKFIEQARQDIQNPERIKLVEETDSSAQSYQKAFEQVQAFRTKRNEHVDRLNANGPVMEQKLTQILKTAERDGDMSAAFHASLAMRNLLLARLYVVKFLNSNAQEDADRVYSEYSTLQSELEYLDKNLQNPERRAQLADIRRLEQGYIADFKAVVSIIFARNDVITNTLDKLGPAIAKSTEDLKLSIMAEQDKIGPAVQASNDNALFVIASTGSTAILLGMFIAFILTRSVLRQIGCDPAEIAEITDQLARGNMAISFRDNAIGVYASMKTMVNKLSGIVSEVTAAAENVASGSEELSASSQSLSQGATEQAASIEEVSSSMEEMSANISLNAENARQTESLATQAALDAQEGGNAVSQTVEAMKHIAEKISIVEEIARQTNLLALNAAIEAARAGEHGKGFAVVAAEVRKLAERSGTAAAEISELSSSSVEVAERAGTMLMKLVPDIKKTADLVQEIASASSEQNAGAEQINKAIQQLDQVVQQNASASEEMSSTSEELASQASQLQESMGFFRISDTALGVRRKVKAVAAPAAIPKATPAKQLASARKPEPVVDDSADEGFSLAMEEDMAFERF